MSLKVVAGGRRPSQLITPYSVESIGLGLTSGLGYLSTGGSTTWGVNSTAIFVPFALTETVIVDKVFTANGGATAGTWDIGVYDNASTPNRLFSAAQSNANVAITQSGTSVLQERDITNYGLAPGNYYLAMVMSNNSGTIISKRTVAGTNIMCAAMGCAQMASASPLPTTATFATYALVALPIFGISARSLAA